MGEPAMNKEESQNHMWFLVKMSFMLLLCLADMGLNSSLEFDEVRRVCLNERIVSMAGFTRDSSTCTS